MNEPNSNETAQEDCDARPLPNWMARYAIPVCVIVILALPSLPYPLGGDQALFLVGAKAMNQGGALYADFWDLKQPGIYIFYWLAGRIFGFSELGIHLFELVWMCLLAVALTRLSEAYFDTKWLASLVALPTIGIYYLGSSAWHLTQLEILVALPMVLCIWAGSTEFRSPRKEMLAFVLSGLCAACISIFKLVLLPLPAAALALSFGFEVIRLRRPIAQVFVRRVVPTALGFVTGLICLMVWLWAEGTLANFLWTTFSLPFEAIASAPNKSIRVLIASTYWFGFLYFPWTPFIVIAIYDFVSYRRDLLTAQLLAWLASGMIVIFVQSFSWWQYHYLLLFVPAGVLAFRGVDIMMAQFTKGTGRVTRVSLTVGLVLLIPAFGTSLAHGFDKLKKAAATTLDTDENWVREYQSALSERYRTGIDETRHLLEKTALRGPIYVFGDPIYYVLAERGQAIAVNGWSPEFWIESQWAALPNELLRAQPVYLFVSSSYEELIRRRSPATVELIIRLYKVVRESPAGTWYRTSEDPVDQIRQGSSPRAAG